MEEKFLSFVAEIMDVRRGSLSMETAYKEFGVWDSLMMLNLVMEIEQEYGISIPMEKVGVIMTLKDLFDLINLEDDE